MLTYRSGTGWIEPPKTVNPALMSLQNLNAYPISSKSLSKPTFPHSEHTIRPRSNPLGPSREESFGTVPVCHSITKISEGKQKRIGYGDQQGNSFEDFIDREEAADDALDEEQAAEGIMKLRRG
jgi:hypothetical protein